MNIVRNKETHPLDSDVMRDRTGRMIVTIMTAILIPLMFTLLANWLGHLVFKDLDVLVSLATIIGAGLGITTTIWFIGTKSIINNSTTGVIVTQDSRNSVGQIRSNGGSGRHIDYSWKNLPTTT